MARIVFHCNIFMMMTTPKSLISGDNSNATGAIEGQSEREDSLFSSPTIVE